MPASDCSIVILAHNGADFTEKCLGSMLTAAELPGELLLVDNGSTDRTPELLDSLLPRFRESGVTVRHIRHAENLGCSAARNRAWSQATRQYVVFMDNDTAVCSRDWLTAMSAVLKARPEVALVGPKLIYPYRPHPIQCAGVEISRLGRICFRGRGRPRSDPDFAIEREVPALISACWIMRRSLAERIGMLDELFHPVQYEDLDLCLRAGESGHKVVYTPTAEIYHFEGITTKSFGQAEYRRNIARNSSKFRERWRERFRTFDDRLPASAYRWLERDELGLTPELDLTQH